MIDSPCGIWNTPAKITRLTDGDSIYFDSPRAGGKYKITGSASSVLRSLDNTSKALTTSWLYNQRRAGVEYPAITSALLSASTTFRPLTTTERIERTLLLFNQTVRIGEAITINHRDEFSMDRKEESFLAAVSETESKGELVAVLELMRKMGLLEDTTQVIGLSRFTPAAQGWLQIEKLLERLPSTAQAFVAMWFNPEMELAYVEGIEPAITDSGYRAVRIDKKEHNNKIDDEIIAEIRRSKFLVADFTCEKEKVRGGVYFESGFAMGLGLPVFWTVKDHLDDVHFDTRQYNHIVWDTPQKLRILLKARIGAVIGDGPLPSH